MEVKVIKSGPIETNTYIVSKDNKTLIIDPAYAYDKIVKYVENNNLKVLAILLTHGHFDHIESCNKLAELYDCKIYINKKEVDIVTDPILNGSRKNAKTDYSVDKKYLATFDKEVILKLDNFMVDVMFTPGHSIGSCCYLIGKELFSGDTLFKDGIGRVDLATGSAKDMDKSLKYIFTLKNDVVVFPGHGDDTTILKERKRYI